MSGELINVLVVIVVLGIAISYRLFHIISIRIIDSQNPKYAKLFLENKGYMRSIWVRAHRLDGNSVKKYVKGRRRFIYLKPGQHTVTLSCRKDASILAGTAFESFNPIDVSINAEPNRTYLATLESGAIVIREM